MTDARWLLLQEMKPRLLETFQALGVVRVEYVAAFPDQDDAWVWLGTDTDAERDALANDSSQLLVQVRHVADQYGFNPNQVSGVTVQSEETVSREFEGDWFYALR